MAGKMGDGTIANPPSLERGEGELCPRCKSFYAGKIPILDFKDTEFLEGKRKKPLTIMTTCHGVHSEDPYQGK